MSFIFAGIIGIISTTAVILFARPITEIFSGNNGELTAVTVYGLRIYSFNFVLAGINILAISILQSVQRVKAASIVAVIRSTVLVYAALLVLPKFLGSLGIWLSMPSAETGTFLVIAAVYLLALRKEKKSGTEHMPG